MSTAYHAKYFACELTRIGGTGVERLSRSLFDACVDLNPHQIEAALFAFRSPISKGVLLADEVGLGKTIEAGLVLCQLWAERRRRLLVICPASIRKQWALELEEKLNLPAMILDAQEYQARQSRGIPNPFEAPAIVISSMHFASACAADIRTIAWDLVVIDEAHKLRNAYRPSNRMGQNIRWALEDRRKLLLTATPLQNSLLELYGLSTLIDDHLFGDLPSFRSQFVKAGGDLEDLRNWLRSLTCSRIEALEIGFEKMAEMGAAQRAVIFTESRRTQAYLKDFLEANGYAGRVITFNGTNKEPETTAIYERWVKANEGSGRATGSRPVDVRTAIIEHYRDHGQILIATEAAAEGVNLQFCSLVVNFDMPWNPQRIEQRIGRCHRYGQKHDVVVINFLNEKNEADRRVHELLEEKFSLFSGVFGASDEVLGTIESGVDFERRVLDIYQQCRTPEEIETAFQRLRRELDEQIQIRMAETRQKLLEYFDEDVHARLRVNLEGARQQLDRVGMMFWRLTRFVLDGQAKFDEANLAFDLVTPPRDGISPGHYRLISKEHENVPGAFLYRLSHPLGEYVTETGNALDTPNAHVTFDISGRPTRIALVEAQKGCSGWLHLQRLTIDSFEREEYLLFSGFDDEGRALDQETMEKMFHCDAKAEPLMALPSDIQARLSAEADRYVQATISRSLETNNRHFQEAREKLEKWADDMVLAAKKSSRTPRSGSRRSPARRGWRPRPKNSTRSKARFRNWKSRSAGSASVFSMSRTRSWPSATA